MPLIELARTRWQEYFDRASKAVPAQTATVEVAGPSLGAQIAADWVPLTGISYEPADDTLTLFLEGLEHRVHHPRVIHVDESVGTISSIRVVDPDGNHHIVKFRSALELPPP